MKDLEQELNETLQDLWKRTRAIGFDDRSFLPMLAEYGAVATVERLVLSNTVQHGFVKLHELKRLDLTVEYEILRPKWALLVREDVRRAARARLLAYGMAERDLPMED